MVNKTKQETATALLVDEDELSSSSEEEDQTFKELSSKLSIIRKDKAVIGYIIRNETSATIDLKEPEKLVQYAMFSSQALDSSLEISDLLEIGDVGSILIEGKDNNALCMNIDGNKISIFLEKDADHAEVLKKISP
jgi:predicted regulator of Ras-like GTPase activity (Roadblock/LC7/MglB family)